MFISKAEKDGIHEALASHIKFIQELKRRIHQLEGAVLLLQQAGESVEAPAEPETVVRSEPTDYKALFKPASQPVVRTTGMGKYVKPFLTNMQPRTPVEISVPVYFELKAFRNAINNQMNAMYGFRSYFTTISDDQTYISVERLV